MDGISIIIFIFFFHFSNFPHAPRSEKPYGKWEMAKSFLDKTILYSMSAHLSCTVTYCTSFFFFFSRGKGGAEGVLVLWIALSSIRYIYNYQGLILIY